MRVDVKPHIVENLNDSSTYYNSNHGRIEVAWVKNNDATVTLSISVPDVFEGISSLRAVTGLPTAMFKKHCIAASILLLKTLN